MLELKLATSCSSATRGGTESASMLIERGVKAVIQGTYMFHLAEEKFQEARVPVVQKEEVALKVVDDFAVMDPKSSTRHRAMESIDGAHGKTEEREWFQGIVDDYKSERRREYRNFTKAQSNDKRNVHARLKITFVTYTSLYHYCYVFVPFISLCLCGRKRSVVRARSLIEKTE